MPKMTTFIHEFSPMATDHPYRMIFQKIPEWTGDGYLLDHIVRVMLNLSSNVASSDEIAEMVRQEHKTFFDTRREMQEGDADKGQMVMTDNDSYDALIQQVAICPNRQRWRGNICNKDGSDSPCKFLRKDVDGKDIILWNLTGEFETGKMIWVPLISQRMMDEVKDNKATSLFGVAVAMCEKFAKMDEDLGPSISAFVQKARKEYNHPGRDPSKLRLTMKMNEEDNSFALILGNGSDDYREMCENFSGDTHVPDRYQV
jgi:hypothetical protein